MLYFGGLIVCLLSVLAALLWARMKRWWLALPLAIAFPALVTWPVYWLPLISVEDTSEYSTWYGVFAIFWLAFALPLSVAVTFYLRRVRARTINA